MQFHWTTFISSDVPGKSETFGAYFYGGDVQNKLTSDGCHMNPEGNKMMARGILRAAAFDFRLSGRNFENEGLEHPPFSPFAPVKIFLHRR